MTVRRDVTTLCNASSRGLFRNEPKQISYALRRATTSKPLTCKGDFLFQIPAGCFHDLRRDSWTNAAHDDVKSQMKHEAHSKDTYRRMLTLINELPSELPYSVTAYEYAHRMVFKLFLGYGKNLLIHLVDY